MPLPTYLMSNFPSVRPSLNLQFDSQPTPADMTSHLASVGATFSRASIGTYTDANGIIQEATSGQARPNYSSAGVHEGLLIEESRTNLVKISEDFSVGWAQTAVTVTANQAILPDGLAGADKVTKDGLGKNERVKADITISNSTDYTISVFVKNIDVSQYTTIGARISGGTLFRKTIDWNSSATPALDTSYDSGSPSNAFLEDYGNGWYRFGFTFTSDGTDMDFEVDVDRGGTGENETSSLYVWGAQLEKGSFATSYIPTIPTFTSRASDGTYFDSSGVLQTTSGERIDHKYIDGQWVEAGLLLEGESTNLHPNSGNLTGNNSATNEVSLSLQTVTNPIDGQTQVTRIADNAVNDGHFIQSSTVTADGSSDYTFSILAKAGTLSSCRLLITGGGVFGVGMTVDLSDGSILDGSGTVEDVGNGWYILSVTGTSTASSSLASRIYTTDGTTVVYTGSGEYIYVAYRQLEKTSQRTSYIATTGSTATRSADVSSAKSSADRTRDADSYTTATKVRSADVCYIDGTAFTDFYNDDSGTMFFNAKTNDPDGGTSNYKTPFVLKDSTASVGLDFTAINLETSGTNEAYIRGNISGNGTGGLLLGTFSFGDFVKGAEVVDATANSGIIDGGTVANDTTFPFDLTGIGINKLQIGYHLHTDTYLDGSIKKLIYFPRRLSDNELIKLTQ